MHKVAAPVHFGDNETMHSRLALLFLTFLSLLLVGAAAAPVDKAVEAMRAETLVPYDGPSVEGVDTRTLHGKVMAGYQGWFNTPGDGAGRGWFHWSKSRDEMGDGTAKVDLWPDMSEYGEHERYATGFTNPDGTPAEVFSSYNRDTVLRHFQWMRKYGIDGAFVQRFMPAEADVNAWRHRNTVLGHCREGANRNGRAYAVMYDLSGLGEGETQRVKEDWRRLRERMKITEDSAYLHHDGKPVVAVWGMGFADGRKYTLAECLDLVKFLQEDPQVGGCTVMVGVPAYWREGKLDSLDDPMLHEIIRTADLVSPWTVGRYDSPATAKQYAGGTLSQDLAWCREAGNELLPVVFPGFSWHNMYDGPLNQIPRRRGQFFWTQLMQAKAVGAEMIYVAMFDEVDEATAIFKCTNMPPVGEQSKFLDYEGLPTDTYLRLTGRGREVLNGERPATETPPLGE